MTCRATLWLLMCIFCTAGLLTGCQSSKIAYGNSYYFKQTPRPVQPSQVDTSLEKTSTTVALPEANELLVANEEKPASVKDIENLIAQAQHQMMEVAEKSNNEALKEKADRIDNIHTAIKDGTLSKKEIRAKRKELRQEVRSLVKAYKAAPDSAEGEQQMDQKLRLSLILGAGGLLLFILGAAVAGPIGGVFALLGLLALIGGLVMLIIWGVEQ